MIRFKTIEPDAGEAKKPSPAKGKAPEPAIPAPVPAEADLPDIADKTAAPAKGLTRKTPLRAKKTDSARLFRD